MPCTGDAATLLSRHSLAALTQGSPRPSPGNQAGLMHRFMLAAHCRTARGEPGH